VVRRCAETSPPKIKALWLHLTGSTTKKEVWPLPGFACSGGDIPHLGTRLQLTSWIGEKKPGVGWDPGRRGPCGRSRFDMFSPPSWPYGLADPTMVEKIQHGGGGLCLQWRTSVKMPGILSQAVQSLQRIVPL
jgi:hypothetical protein